MLANKFLAESARPPGGVAEVLVVGAGPTGLVLALWLARAGVRVRVIDKKAGPGQASRAMVVHARTLEFYRQLGFAGEVVAAGIMLGEIHLRKGGKDFAVLPLRDMGEGVTPYPFLLAYPQDDHERLLVGKLEEAGVGIEWGVELADIAQDGDCVRATILRGGTPEEVNFSYLCGCDGAHSLVRHRLGVAFVGGTYENLYYVADVRAEGGLRTDGYLNLAGGGFALMLPVRSGGVQRLIGLVPPSLSGRASLTFGEIRETVERLLHVRVAEVNWFSTYKVHHRVTGRFQVGRCFLAGDAAHVHSPTGGQGMNTGIGDAVNLAWKLAAVLEGRAAPSVLDSYEPERLPFARALVATTDRAFALVAGRGLVGRAFRTAVLPLLVPAFTRFSGIRRLLFQLVSQVRINYRRRPLSAGRVGRVQGGDRLPWVPGADNFAPLASLDWQIHVYGQAGRPLSDAAAGMGLAVREFPWSDPAARAGLGRDAAYLIRPDGHVAVAWADQDPARLADYVARQGLEFGPITPPFLAGG